MSTGSLLMEEYTGNKVVSISRYIEIRKEQQDITNKFKEEGMDKFEASSRAWELMFDNILKKMM